METAKQFFLEQVVGSLKLGICNVLIVDKVTLPIIDSIFSVTDLGRKKIFDTSMIDKPRYDYLSRTHAIYFVEGTTENVDLIVNDFANYDNLIYYKAHLLFITHLDQINMQTLARSKALPFIVSLFEVPMNFIMHDWNIIICRDTMHIAKVFNVDILHIKRSDALISPLLYRITLHSLLAEASIDELKAEDLKKIDIWRQFCNLPFPQAHKKFIDTHKKKYDEWALTIETEFDLAKKMRKMKGNEFITFQKAYNVCVKAINVCSQMYKRILPVYELQMEMLKSPKGSYITRINTRLNYMTQILDKVRLLVVSTGIIGKLPESLTSRVDVKLDHFESCHFSLSDAIRQNRKKIIYVADCVTVNEIEDIYPLIVSPKIVSIDEYIKLLIS